MGLTDGGVRNGGLRNLTEISAIPDSGDLHSRYDWSQEDGSSPVTDQTGNGFDLSGTYSGVSVTINGVQAGDFDGVDDEVEATFATESQPNHVFGTFQLRTSGVGQYIIDGAADNEQAFRESGSGEWAINSPSTVAAGSTDTNAHIFSALFDGANSVLRIDGAEIASGDAGTDGLDGIIVGARGNNSIYADVKVGELLYYQTDKTPVQGNVEQYLSDKWGISI